MESANLKDYIFAQEQDRERVTINRFFADQGALLGRPFNSRLGWNLPFMWLGLRLPHERLLSHYNRPPKKFRGDVDVMGGALEPVSREEYERCLNYLIEEGKRLRAELPEEHRYDNEEEIPPPHNLASKMVVELGKIKWPPRLTYIAATEVKAAYYNARGDLKGKGSEYNGRDQARELCEMGYDRVALSRFIVTEPTESGTFNPWMVASARSSRAMDEYLDHPDPQKHGIYIEEQDPYGTILISNGAVLGKSEHMAGGMTSKWLLEPPLNPYQSHTVDIRRAMEETLLEVMSRHPVPLTYPVLVLACSDRVCGNLYVATRPNPEEVCPLCHKPPCSGKF